MPTEAGTRGHVFVVMLAYLLERELDRSWRPLDLTVSEALDELGSLRGVEITIGNTTCQLVPQPQGLSQELLTRAEITLPQFLPLRKVHVATRKKTVERIISNLISLCYSACMTLLGWNIRCMRNSLPQLIFAKASHDWIFPTF